MVETRAQRKAAEAASAAANTAAYAWSCPCGGGQSCIITRRYMGDWVHEDMVFKQSGLPFRKSCLAPYSALQESAMAKAMMCGECAGNVVHMSLFDRWLMDGEIENSKMD